MIKTQDYFRELVMMLFIRKWIILYITLAFVIGALIVAFAWPPVYEASGSVLVMRKQPLSQPTSVDNVPTELTDLKEDDVSTEMLLITARVVAGMTADWLVDNVEKYKGTAKVQKKALADRIASNLTARLEPRSKLIKVRLAWDNAEDADLILTTYLDRYLQHRSNLYNPAEALDFFRNQFQVYNDELRKREDLLINLAQQDFSSNPNAQISSNLMVQQNLVEQLSHLRERRNGLAQQVHFLREAVRQGNLEYFSTLDIVQLGRLAEKLLTLTIQRQELLTIYTPTSSPVEGVERQIKDTRATLEGEVNTYIGSREAELRGLDESIVSLIKELSEIERRNVALNQNTVKTNRIRREIGLLEDSYSTFAKRLEEARINEETRSDTMFSVSISDPPTAPQAPVFPKRPNVILIGSILGFVAACMIGFIIEFFDHSFKRPEDVENYAGLRLIFSIRHF